MKLWLKIIMIVSAFGILYISFTRAGLEKVNDDERYDRLRNISISYQQKETGSWQCYKLPESRILSNNPIYFFKKIRDNLWIQFSRNPIDKSRITLLVADKKISETITLYKKNTDNKFLKENIDEAEIKIESVRKIIIQLDQKDLEVKKIKQKVDQANSFYQYIIEQISLNKEILRCDE
jgi:hypothetical protein